MKHRIKKLKRIFYILYQFVRRDIQAYRHRLPTLIINLAIIYPTLYTVSFAYIQSRAYFGADITARTVLFSGNITLLALVVSFTLAFTLLSDLDGDRHIDYLITLLSPRLILIERIFFDSLFVFFLITPFFPMCKLMLGNQFDTSNTSWTSLYGIIFAASFCCTTYNLLAACTLRLHQIENFWVRFTAPLDIFGGAFVPLSIMKATIPIFGTIVLANPFIYITEGARSAILGTTEFIPVITCIGILILFTLFFMLCSFYLLKKRMDYV